MSPKPDWLKIVFAAAIVSVLGYFANQVLLNTSRIDKLEVRMQDVESRILNHGI